jgi:hypothetical protein
VTRAIASLLRLAARVICLIVIAAFVVFVVNQTSSASTHQQNELNGGSSSSSSATPSKAHESTLHRTLDEASDALTSPFSSITSGWSSQWAIRSLKLVLALLVYGFGLGYLARFIRVRT